MRSFGLKSIFLFVASCAVLISVARGIALRTNAQRRAVVELIDAAGGNLPWVGIWYDDQHDPGRSPSIRGWWGDVFHHVEVVTLFQTERTDELLGLISQLKSVSELSLEDTDVTDDGLKIIGKMAHLRRLRIHTSNLSIHAHFAITHLTELESLELIGTGISASAHRELREAFPNCQLRIAE